MIPVEYLMICKNRNLKIVIGEIRHEGSGAGAETLH